MRLTTLAVQGFQCYRERKTIVFHPEVTVFAGRNDVGKSALLRLLLSPIESQSGLHNDFYIELDCVVGRRELSGAMPGLHSNTPAAALDPLIAHLQGRDEYQVRLTWQLGVQRALVLSRAAIESPSPTIDVGPSPSGAQWAHPPAGGNSTAGAAEFLHGIEAVYTNAFAYISPRRTSTYPNETAVQLRAETVMRGDGSNVTDVLATLMLGDRLTVDRIVAVLRDAFEDVRDIAVPPLLEPSGSGPRGSIWVDYVNGDRHVLSQCGTGIEQLLVLATGVLTAKTPRIFLIDEPHAYLHPHAERTLVRFIDEHPEHQFVIVTHSAAVLRNYPLQQARLVHRTPSGTDVTALKAPSVLLSELGITAADLWLPDGFLWVEGPTDVAVLSAVVPHVADLKSRSVQIAAMPSSSKFIGKEASAFSSFEFIETVVEAIEPTPAPLMFLFDSDEKSSDTQARILRASGNRARFLRVREIENLLLDAASVAEYLSTCAVIADSLVVSSDSVQEIIDEALLAVDDPSIYRAAADDGLSSARASGFGVLNRVFQHFTSSDYEKSRDNAALASIVFRRNPAMLQPLVEVLQEIAGNIGEAREG